MIKVMLVDDYLPTLRYFESIICWADLGMTVVAKSNSSIRALEDFKKHLPDILITDIGMPQMDGLELASLCKEIQSETRVIFLTCHEDFHYAKQAFQISADDYLIKDDLTEDKLRESLMRASNMLRQTQDYMKHHSYREDLQRNREVLMQSFFQQLISGNAIEETLSFGQRLGIRWEYTHFISSVGYMNISSFIEKYDRHDLPLITYAVCNIAQEIASSLNVSNPEFTLSPISVSSAFSEQEGAMFVCIVNMNGFLHLDGYQLLREYLEDVNKRVLSLLGVDLIYGYSKQFTNLKQIRSVFSEIKQARKSVYYSGERMVSTGSDFNARWITLVPEHLSKCSNELMLMHRKNDYTGMKKLVAEAGASAKSISLDPYIWLNKCVEWMKMLGSENPAYNQDDFIYFLQRSMRLSDTLQLIDRYLTYIAGALYKNQNVKLHEPKLQVIEEYVLNHLSENMTTLTMAQHLYLNPNYFSRWFKKMTGENFIDYVHRLKMDLATKLLQNKFETVGGIAMKLGYNDRTYFARVFKKYIGMSPSEYRER